MSEEKKEELVKGEESGVSIREIFSIIGKKIWYVLGGALAVTLAAILVFMFAINPAKQRESMSFTIVYPMSDEGKYPDGSMFNYRDIVSRSVVQKTVERDEKFSGIDLNKLFKYEGIAIAAEKMSSDENAPYLYTVSLKRSYFNGVKAEEFIEALTEEFTAFVENKANSLNYEIDESTFVSASYKDQLRILDEEKEALTTQYDIWIKEYSAGHVVQGKSLNDYRTEVMITLTNSVRTLIENDLSSKGYEYFNDGVTSEQVKTRVEQLKDELKRNKAILDNLKGKEETPATYAATYASTQKTNTESSDGNTVVIMPSEQLNDSQMLAYYSERNAVVEQQIAHLTEGVTNDDYSDIVAKIKKFGEEKLKPQLGVLNARANTLKTVVASMYARDTVVTFNTQRVTTQGGTSLVIVGVGVFVVSLIVFAVIAFFAGKKGTKKKASVAESEKPAESGENE